MDLNNNNDIILLLIHNQNHFKDLTQEYRNKRDDLLIKEDFIYHDDIKSQYREICISLLAAELSAKTGKPIDLIIPILETVNIVDYLEK